MAPKDQEDRLGHREVKKIDLKSGQRGVWGLFREHSGLRKD